METIQCEVGESPSALEDVRAAVARCREQGAALELVGIVRTSMLDAPQPACGERIRRFKQVQQRVEQGIRIARGAGITPSVSVRVGMPEPELAREAGAIAAVAGVLGPMQRRGGTAAGRPAPLWPGRWL